MLTSLKITGFRAFESLTIEDLGRVNLFVGENNVGKTSVLEAFEILGLGGSPSSLVRAAWRRKEYTNSFVNTERQELDLSHLFHGHMITIGSNFSISGKKDLGDPEVVECCIANRPPKVRDRNADEALEEDPDILEDRLALSISGTAPNGPFFLDLSPTHSIRSYGRISISSRSEGGPEVFFVTTDALDAQGMSAIWNQVMLKPEEKVVVDALKIIEPGIERIGFQSSESPPMGYRQPIGTKGVIAKLSGLDDPVPLGSLGEGIRRLLSISLAIVPCKNGMFLIDEIDTGLHYSVMEKMWRMVIETARKLDVQVFATTHSLDCVRALGWLYKEDQDLVSDVRLHRIDKGRERTTVLSAKDLAIAERQELEVR